MLYQHKFYTLNWYPISWDWALWPTTWTRMSRGARTARRARPPWPIVAECHWPVEEKLCGSRHMHMCGPTGRMPRAARRSHTARIARNARRSHTARNAHRSHCTQCTRVTQIWSIVSHCTQVAHYTVSVLSKRDALKSRMSRTNNAWQAMHTGNARMSRTARIAHTKRWMTERICLTLQTRQHISDRHFVSSTSSDKFAQWW